MFYFTEDLITAAQASALFPTSQNTFGTSVLIGFANEELLGKLVPKIHSVREDFFGTTANIPLRSGVSRYPIPERALGNALKDVFYVPNITQPLVRYILSKVHVHDLQSFRGSTGTPGAFYMEGDMLVLTTPPQTVTGVEYLKVAFYQRPSQLVSTSACAKITAITVGASQTTLTLNTDLTSVLNVGDKIDIQKARSPFLLWSTDVVIQTVSATQIVVNNVDIADEGGTALPTVGDWVTKALYCNIPMIPQEFHPILSEMIAARTMKGLGDSEKLASANAGIAEMMNAAIKLIANRVEGEPDVVYDSQGILSSVNVFGFRSVLR